MDYDTVKSVAISHFFSIKIAIIERLNLPIIPIMIEKND